jgi:hypothetical protein
MFITPKLLLIAFAIFMTILFLPALLNTKKFQKEIKRFMKDENALRLGAFFLMIISFLFLSVHWKFTGGWYMLIPIIGWGMLIKGAIWFWFPEFTYKMVKKFYIKSENQTGLLSFFELLLTIGILYVGIYIY